MSSNYQFRSDKDEPKEFEYRIRIGHRRPRSPSVVSVLRTSHINWTVRPFPCKLRWACLFAATLPYSRITTWHIEQPLRFVFVTTRCDGRRGLAQAARRIEVLFGVISRRKIPDNIDLIVSTKHNDTPKSKRIFLEALKMSSYDMIAIKLGKNYLHWQLEVYQKF